MAKDTHSVLLGMLSDAGSQTRAPDPPGPPPTPAPKAAPPTVSGLAEAPGAAVAARPPSGSAREHVDTTTGAPEAPRTLRLRAETATWLRSAWLDAKRDDVLLTAQDFASNLVEDALRSRRRRRTPATP